MGICESNNNEKNIKEQIKKDGVIPGTTDYMNFDNLKIIEKQKENSICKIINGNKAIGTGFLCLIPYPDKTNQLPVLITCNHVINGNEKEVKLIFNNTIEKILKLDNTRKMYISNEKEKDITIIEIKEEDNYDFNNMLEIDYDIFENEDLNKIFKSIYIVHYPFGKEACFTMNVIENIDIKDEKIKHKCATDSGASGAPIINMKNCKVIGIHRGEEEGSNINVGTLLKESIINFNKNKNGNKNGILYYKNGRYEGEVKNGKREGKGIMYYNNGEI